MRNSRNTQKDSDLCAFGGFCVVQPSTTEKLSTTEHTEVETVRSAGLPIAEALQIAIQIADALDKAHRKGVTHRDLKPSNVILTASAAKLLDFLLSAMPTDQNLTAQGSILGTPRRRPPLDVRIEEVARPDDGRR